VSTINYEYQEPTMERNEQMRVLIGMLLASHNYRTTMDPTDVSIAMPKGTGNGDLSGLLGLSMALTLDLLLVAGVDPEAFIAQLSAELMKDGI